LSVCKSQLDTNGAKSLLSVIAEHPIKPVDGEIMQELVTLFKQNKEQFYQLYETALRNVNHPHYRKKGLQLQTLLDAVHEKSQLNDLRAYLHTLQIDMAYHNHTGNIKLGDFAWEQYLKLKPRFLELGEKATEFDTDFRCKRAVNLMDEFRYDEAADVLIQAGEKEEKFAQLNANFFDGNPDDFPRERRGWVYSSLGQVLAFQGDKEQAELCFRDALRCFDNKDNIEREWVYLGHLACDFPQDSQALLNEVFEHLPQNTEPFEEPFILALKLKSVYVFGDTASQNDWAKQMLVFIHNNEETLPTDHPWGLIYQITAMLFDKLGNKNQANNFYDLAIDSFCQGEGILQELCNYCKARKQGKTVPEKIRFNYW
jgi:tetratricopeptide (TPR) repeat protein